jgi:hypothetical protein
MAQQFRIAGVPEHCNLLVRQAIARDAFDSVTLGVSFIGEPGGTGPMSAALAAQGAFESTGVDLDDLWIHLT